MLFKDFISILAVLIILILITIVLFFLNKKTKKEIKDEEIKINKYKNNFNKIKDSKEVIKHLNELAKDFFKENYKIKKNHSYLELAELFRKKNKLEHAEFCDLMSETIYSGRKLDETKTKKIISLFSKIIENPHLD